jgi:E3 ubiquitin-protein ligase BRE1
MSNGGTPFTAKDEEPPGAGEVEDISPAYKGLEAYRKEAIFRKMREACRDLARSNAKVFDLQERMRFADERLVAMNEFWNTLVEDVQILVQESKLPADQHAAMIDALELTSRQPSTSAFKQSLHDRNASIKALLASIISLSPGSSPEVDELQAKCHRLAQESAALRSRLSRTDEERHELIEELNSTVEQLRRMERLHDRYHSATVKATERPGAQKEEEEAEQARKQAAEAEKQAALRRKEQADGIAVQASGPNGFQASVELANEVEESKKLAESRLEELERWREQFAALRKENEALRSELQDIPSERVLRTPLYSEIFAQYETHRAENERLNSVNDRIELENSELRAQRKEFEAQATAEANKLLDDLRTAVKTQEADVARMRVQRDDAQAELSERKAKDTVKSNQVEEMKALVTAKDLRIEVLKTEIRRLQSSWAAHNGDLALLERLKAGLDKEDANQLESDIGLISDLQSRLRLAEEKFSDLHRQLEARTSSTTEEELIKRVAELEKEVAEVTDLFAKAADTASQTPTAEAVKALLVSQQDELQQVKRELATATSHTTALCDELEKMGAAYAEAQRVAAERIADTGRMEEKVARLATEKAKADNKYFSAMRAKDTVDNERRAAVRNAERKTAALEQYAEVEKKWSEQWRSTEGEMTSFRRSAAEANKAKAEAEGREARLKAEMAGLQQAYEATVARLEQHTTQYVEENRQRVAAQERCDKLQRDLERAKKQLSGNGGLRKKSVADDDEIGDLKRLVFCSACHDRIRDRIIVRCLHTFCHDCVDARIQTRQRKCPSCGLGFSTSDVQALYFQ